MKGNSVTKPTAAKKNSAAATDALKAAVEADAPFVVCIPGSSFTGNTVVTALSVTFMHDGTPHNCSSTSEPHAGYILIDAGAPSLDGNVPVDAVVNVSFSADGVSLSRRLEAILYPARD